MQTLSAVRLRRASLSALLLTPLALARPQALPQAAPVSDDLPTQIRQLKAQLAQQQQAIKALQAALATETAAPATWATDAASSSASELQSLRGAGTAGAPDAPVEQASASAVAAAVPATVATTAPATAPGTVAAGGTVAAAGAASPAVAAVAAVEVSEATMTGAAGAVATRAAARRQAAINGAPQTAAGAVGQAPPRDSRPPAVAPLFEQPGVLTPRGKYVLEPSLQFAYSSSNRVALVGYTIIPALLIGLIDVREVKRNTLTAALTGRVGLSKRLEAEIKVPYVYRSDSTVSRELFTGTAVERVFDSSGHALGDIEAALRYQLNDGGADKPYFVGGLRFKSRSGRDPFSVVTDCTRRCVGDNATGTGLPLALPTGSGFYSLQPSLTWLLPSDPAVFFGSVSYLHNLKRSGISRLVLDGEREPLGEIKPGDVIGFNFGMGMALNDKASFSLGYDHSTIGRTKQNGVAVPGAVRTQLGTLLVGFSYRLNDRRTINVAIGAGLTRDTPDVSLTIRIPTSF
ncbi:acetate kinase [Massilia sp. PWRC2]|uniref:acetate kinase n=1 Tax=Massilia sp. PWRC2 TaxID=2804626 RepID=UPI003CF0E618